MIKAKEALNTIAGATSSGQELSNIVEFRDGEPK